MTPPRPSPPSPQATTSPAPLGPADPEAALRRPPPPVRWDGVQRVHLIGVCGSAMGALALMLRESGYEVRGSDAGAYPPMSTTLRAAGIPISEGYAASNLDWGPHVVVVGNVVRPSHPEAAAVRERGLPYCSLPQALAGLFLRDRHSVVVTGTHGKTTTSSMVAWILHEAGFDPGFLIGGVTGNFGTNFRLGGGPVFVVEGDEYDTAYFDKGPKFLHYGARTASVNNVEYDHADIFHDLDAVEAAFERFTAALPAHGRLVVPADDPIARRLGEASPAQTWRFAVHAGAAPAAAPDAELRATDVRAAEDGTKLMLQLPPRGPGEPAPQALPVHLPLWGEHNVRDALTAAGLAYAVGAEPADIARALGTFRLPVKRQQLRGVEAGVPVIDDFAHHPTAIRETLRAVRARYPGRRVLALFEAESNTSRRRVFQRGFAQALGDGADVVWFCPPLDKAGDQLAPPERLNMADLVRALRERGTPTEVIADMDALAGAVVAEARPDEDVIVAMSGRDFHGIHAKLLAGLRAR